MRRADLPLQTTIVSPIASLVTRPIVLQQSMALPLGQESQEGGRQLFSSGGRQLIGLPFLNQGLGRTPVCRLREHHRTGLWSRQEGSWRI